MKSSHCFARLLLALALIGGVAYGQKTAPGKELVGSWNAKTVTLKQDGHDDDVTVYKASELVTRFLDDGTFVTTDRSQGDPIVVSGKYEVTNDHRLKQTVLDVKGSAFPTDPLLGRVIDMQYSVASDQLTLIVRLLDKSGLVIGASESVFVKASP